MIRREYSRAQRTEGRVARRRASGDTLAMASTLDHLGAVRLTRTNLRLAGLWL